VDAKTVALSTQPRGFVRKEEEIVRSYKKNTVKLTQARHIRDMIRKELQNTYRNAEYAYSSMDFTGVGYISEEAFLASKTVARLPFSQE